MFQNLLEAMVDIYSDIYLTLSLGRTRCRYFLSRNVGRKLKQDIKKLNTKISYYCIRLVVYGLYFDIRLSRKISKKDLRIHILQI